MKNGIRGLWWLVAIVFAALLLLFLSFSGPSNKPRAEDEFPPAETPPST